MRLKRIISILLVPIMLLSSANMASAEEAFYEYESKVMTSLGIIDELSDGGFSPSDYMGRAEFLSWVMQAVSLPGIANRTSFKDVRPNYWALGDIGTAEEQGIVSGDPNGNFAPDRGITYGEALKILISALGFESEAQSKGTFPTGYLRVGSDLKITKGINIAADESITKAIAVKMLYNAKEAPLMINYGTKLVVDNDTNYLNRYHDIYEGEGIVTATDTVSLDNNTADTGCVMIGDKSLDIGGQSVKALLGHNVRYFYRENRDGDDTLLYIESYKNTVAEFDTESIKAYEDHIYTVYRQKDSGKTDRFKIAPYTDVVYNGTAKSVYTKNELLPEDGSICLIDNNHDDVYDVAVIYAYEVFVIQSFQSDQGKLYSKDGTSISLDSYESLELVDTRGNEVETDLFREYTVLLVSKSNQGLRIVVSNEIVSGIVKTSYTEDGKRYVKIDKDTYEIGKAVPQDKMIEINLEYDFCLDAKGRVQAIKPATNSSISYGYMIWAKRSVVEETGEDALFLRIFTQDGKFLKAATAEKLKYNGSRNNALALAEADLVADTGYKSQLIGYQFDAEGRIKVIDTEGDITSSTDSLNRIFTGTAVKYRWKLKPRTFSGAVATTAGALVFGVPSNSEIATDDDYSVRRASDVQNDSEFTGGLRCYRTNNETLLADIVVLEDAFGSGTVAISKNDTFSIVLGVTESLNEDDELVHKIKLVKNGKEAEYVCASEKVTKNILNPTDQNIGEYELGRGDTIMYALNSQNEIANIALHYDYSKKLALGGRMVGGYNGAPGYVPMKVYKKEGEYIGCLFIDQEPQAGIIPSTTEMYFFNTSTYSMMVFDENIDGYVKTASIADINDFVHNGNNYSTIYASTWYGEGLSMVVYR